MWVFTNKGFVSIVQHYQDPDTLLVRARKRQHLEALFPGYEVQETLTGKDYWYRVFTRRGDVARIIADQVQGIDYGNYKGSIPPSEQAYHDACSAVWGVMYDYQRRK
ncbi:MAG: hypothetical protein AB7I29_09190 [Geobacter sp.]